MLHMFPRFLAIRANPFSPHDVPLMKKIIHKIQIDVNAEVTPRILNNPIVSMLGRCAIPNENRSMVMPRATVLLVVNSRLIIIKWLLDAQHNGNWSNRRDDISKINLYFTAIPQNNRNSLQQRFISSCWNIENFTDCPNSLARGVFTNPLVLFVGISRSICDSIFFYVI